MVEGIDGTISKIIKNRQKKRLTVKRRALRLVFLCFLHCFDGWIFLFLHKNNEKKENCKKRLSWDKKGEKMKKIKNIVSGVAALFFMTSLVGCRNNSDTGVIKLTIWVSEADKPFATSVVNDFKAKNPDKKYQFAIDIQGENDVATRVLNDVENAADVYSCLNDQVSKLINGDALARIAGERLERVKKANSEDSIESVTMTVNDVEGVYGMPYTDNTFFLYYNKA